MKFPDADIFKKGTISAEFWANRPKLCGKCAFPQKFHTRKFGEITIFLAVKTTVCESFISRINIYFEQVYFFV